MVSTIIPLTSDSCTTPHPLKWGLGLLSTSVCGRNLLVYEILTYYCLRSQGTIVQGVIDV
jgi:hypothetical protein